MSPFDIVNHINEKTNVELDFNEYNAWMINLALANHMQTVLFANEMNKYSDLSKNAQYLFYYHGIPKGKRFGKWPKKEKYDEELFTIIKNVFNINNIKAQKVLELLSDEQKECLKNIYGGK